MDCDGVLLLVAVGEGRTLTGVEELQFHDHVAGCEKCRALTVETADDLPEPLGTAAELMQLVEKSRWQLVGGHVVERDDTERSPFAPEVRHRCSLSEALR